MNPRGWRMSVKATRFVPLFFLRKPLINMTKLNMSLSYSSPRLKKAIELQAARLDCAVNFLSLPLENCFETSTSSSFRHTALRN